GWDNRDTALHLDQVADVLAEKLAWPNDEEDVESWRESWRSAFTLRHREVITTSKALAVRLAELARAIRDRINTILKIETKNGPVTKLMKAFQEALVHDLDADGFADMYAQTIAYGLLSARVTNPKANTADGFAAQLPVTNPFLKELMETFLHIGGRRGKANRGAGIDFDELGVSEVVELLDDANMEAVVRDFGDRNPQEDPVIHFYELFLKEYDAKKRMQRGVFYTPRPVVSYIVRSVHELLQTEFGLADGLADTAIWGEMAKRHEGLKIPDGVKPNDRFVTILDPAAGTGTFLVEAIEVIRRTLEEKWKREGHGEKKVLDLWNDYVPNHLLPRLHGYELLMAPYAIAHLKIGLKLHETGYRFESDERARIYLTNALEPAHDFSGQFEFMIPALAHEAEAVNNVKRSQRFTVVIGNPPYSTISQNRNDWIRGLIDTYFELDDGRMEERGNRNQLQDDYVKFYRFAHHLTATGGVVGLITNSSYLRGPWFRGMRYQLHRSFGRIDVLDLHGGQSHSLDQHEVDQNVFEITTSVAIALLLRKSQNGGGTSVGYSDVLGSRQSKYDFLAAHSRATLVPQALSPSRDNQWRFVPHDSTGQEEWSTWTALPDFFKSWGAGVLTNRNGLAVDEDRHDLLKKIRRFADLSVPDAAVEEQYGFSSNYQWDTGRARRAFASQPVRNLAEPYTFRPFDFQWIYWHSNVVYNMRGDKMGVFRQESPPLGLMFSRNTKHGYYSNTYITRRIADRHCMEEANVAPLYSQAVHGLLPQAPDSNLSDRATSGVAQQLGLRLIRGRRGDLSTTCGAEDFLFYVYGVLHSEDYRTRYAEFLKIDFPRLPLTSHLELFRELACLGGELVPLHLVEAPAQQALSARYDKAAKAWRYEVTRGQQLPVTLSFKGPEKPVVGKVGWSDNTVWIDTVKPQKGATDSAVTGTVGFHGVPEDVWNFHIGGYQVCEKWLRDRKGRTLASDDIGHYHRIVIALHETIRLMQEIDEVIDAHGGWPGAFASTAQPPEAKDAMGSRTPQRGKRASARVDLQQPNLFG
ncbi:MAG: type ISP restriction/modification enzyme, partial [Candidatus Omnitrophota bacterium]|nr:type ISP restriction/modification enzyme [Candidatus Omnitrophota bacterium]